jgi:hypothetical protein
MSTSERRLPRNKYWVDVQGERYLQVEQVKNDYFCPKDDESDEDKNDLFYPKDDESDDDS